MPKYQIQITSHQGDGVIQILNYKKKKRKNLQKNGANSSSKTADLNIIILIIISH